MELYTSTMLLPLYAIIYYIEVAVPAESEGPTPRRQSGFASPRIYIYIYT